MFLVFMVDDEESCSCCRCEELLDDDKSSSVGLILSSTDVKVVVDAGAGEGLLVMMLSATRVLSSDLLPIWLIISLSRSLLSWATALFA
jgi:hypothetical protein